MSRMSPGLLKTLMTLGAGVAGAACFLPGVGPFVPFLTALSGVLMGGAHIPEPATANALAGRVAKALRKEERDPK